MQRKIEIGERLPDQRIVKVDQAEMISRKSKIVQALNRYLCINEQEELYDLFGEIQGFAGLGLAIREFEKLVRNKLNSLYGTNVQYDSLNQKKVEEEVSLIKKEKITDPNTGLELERDTVESLVDAISKIIFKIDPFVKNNLYRCSKE